MDFRLTWRKSAPKQSDVQKQHSIVYGPKSRVVVFLLPKLYPDRISFPQVWFWSNLEEIITIYILVRSRWAIVISQLTQQSHCAINFTWIKWLHKCLIQMVLMTYDSDQTISFSWNLMIVTNTFLKKTWKSVEPMDGDSI